MKFKLPSFLFLLLFSVVGNAQYWNSKTNDTLYYESPVIIGNNMGENAMLSLLSNYNTEGGGGYGIISKHSTNHTYLQFHTRSRVGYSSIWDTQSQGAAFCGALYLAKDNANSIDSRSSGGYFVLEFDHYQPYDNSNNIHYLGGRFI